MRIKIFLADSNIFIKYILFDQRFSIFILLNLKIDFEVNV